MTDRRPRHRNRQRLAAVLLGLLPFVLLEAGLSIAGLGVAPLAVDPLAGFGPTTPLFVRDGDHYVIDPPRLRFFAPQSFPARKAPHARRIFVLGGSTVQGRPWSTETSFPTWLRLALEQAEPETDWQIVNCGGISYASYRLALILDEILRVPAYDPDLVVLCAGHNEFLEDRSYGHLRALPDFVRRPLGWLAATRTGHLLLELAAPPERAPPAELGGEVDALLDHEGGLHRYRPDPQWRRGVLAHFRSSLQRMARACARAGVPLVVIDPPANLGDCPPFKSAPWPDGGPEAAELFSDAVRTRRAGKAEQARALFVAAKDRDVCPLRILEVQRRALRDLELPLLDAHALLERDCADGILDGTRLADHVHPTIRGQQLLGSALAEFLVARDLVPAVPPADWGERRGLAYATHLDSLDTRYFARGQLTLEQLERWAEGRVGTAFEREPEAAYPERRR